MAKIVTVTKKEDDEVLLPMGQKKPVLHRYWLQVDRQTKRSYAALEEAQTAAKEIKAAHTIVEVSIYDAETSSANADLGRNSVVWPLKNKAQVLAQSELTLSAFAFESSSAP